MAGMMSVSKRDPTEETLVTEENQGDYSTPRPINPLFEVALIATIGASDALKRKRIVMSMGIDDEDGKARRDIGEFTADVDRFKVTVNWRDTFAGKIPPGHILVSFKGTEVGMLCPFTDGELVDGVPQQNYWKGLFVSEKDLWLACATVAAETSKKDYMFQGMGGDQADDVKAGRDPINAPFVE